MACPTAETTQRPPISPTLSTRARGPGPSLISLACTPISTAGQAIKPCATEFEEDPNKSHKLRQGPFKRNATAPASIGRTATDATGGIEARRLEQNINRSPGRRYVCPFTVVAACLRRPEAWDRDSPTPSGACRIWRLPA